NLGKYAYFLHAVRGDLHAADELYRRAVECGGDPDTCANYANFLETERDDQHQAECGGDPDTCANYASFLETERDDQHQAELSFEMNFLEIERDDQHQAEVYYSNP
ncbi:hypothetical protein T484DRAFT_1837427, partial [Baffinella frigidus]